MCRKIIVVVSLLLLFVPWAHAQDDTHLLAAPLAAGVTSEGKTSDGQPAWVPARPLYGNTSYRSLLLPLLESSDSRERARAAFAVGLIGDRSASGRLTSMLNDTERTVRVFAGLALGFLGDERGIHVCDAVLSADPDWIRYYAIYALWLMDSPRAGAVLDRHRNGQSKFIVDVVRQALKTKKANHTPSPDVSEDGPEPEDLFASLCDAFILESDKWWHKGDFDQTIRCDEAAILVDPTYTDGYGLIAWLQWSAGDDAAAIKTLNRGIETVPDSPETWGALGQHYWMTKRFELALEPLKKAVELGGDHTIRRPYAFCLEKTGHLAECVAQWEVLVEQCPNDPAAPLNLERMRKKLAEQNAAR